VCCSVLQCMLQCVAGVMQCVAVRRAHKVSEEDVAFGVLQCVALSVLQCVAVCCLRRVAVCCRMS